MSTGASRTIVALVAIPLLAAGYIAAMGSSGRCATCERIMRAVLGTEASAGEVAEPAIGSADAAPPVAEADARPRGPMHELVLRDLDGREVSLAEFAGRPMVIEVWATWCGPCRRLRSTLKEIEPQLSEHAKVLTVSVDQQGASAVRRYLDQREGGVSASPFLDLVSSPAFEAALAPHNPGRGIPKMVYVDSEGRVAAIEVGATDGKWILGRTKVLR
jgi:thiol-disulfide isomerase/thioredoxin